MSMTPEMIAKLAAQAAATEDQTETTAGGDFDYAPPVEGVTVGRLIEYIELGKQPQKPYQGKPKPDAESIRIVFELTHPKNVKEIEVNGEKRKIADKISLTLTKKLGEKARFKKLFNKLTYGRAEIKHMAQMLGEAFIIEVIHNKSDDGTKTYANIEKDGEFKIGAPFKVDPLEGTKTPLAVPAALSDLKLFLFDHPNAESWASLFIDGTRTTKVDGKEVEVSKNWLQERIKAAKNFNGSPLHAMLSEVDIDAAEQKTENKKPDANDALAELDAKKAETHGSADSDELAALGL